MAILALEDGKVFHGKSFGATGQVLGELVFNTGITGYQEVLTDPSYAGQIVTMTYPHIGNYGINTEDRESRRPWVSGFVVREVSPVHSNWRARMSLPAYLQRHGIVGICELDTRALTRHLRERGVLRACVSSEEKNPEVLVQLAKSAPSISEQRLVDRVSCTQAFSWNELVPEHKPMEVADFHVVAYDFGIKYNILRHLRSHLKKVTVVPAWTSADEVLKLHPNGVLLANGPGDPEQVHYAIENVRKFPEKLPIFGICLGHQILGLAYGARTYKLKFGHHGSNQPVKNLLSGKVDITTHNHGFAVADLPKELELTHINLNDKSVEGFRHREKPVFSVQYHPEAAPGPHDSRDLFEQFVAMMKSPADWKTSHHAQTL
ncbi:glutamine-hydrolyzing carbamoyl-phosphate synthase small subunit [Candidatus Acetothermia bacterium]|nr:glutamine-hydrolyzing carbamoyl-phosphate synthase small subunit [Candidatus Acetothermia bacterium]MBI3659803.1 glutamine-hydrolyzing carbamoyl-phosphate synthase small subunit [Candidatus Acetothermia bacterium]